MLMSKKGQSADILLQLFYAFMALALLVSIFLLLYHFGDLIRDKIPLLKKP